MTPDYSDGSYDSAVAIVGMAMRVPGAEDPRAFWSLIREGGCALTDFTPEELSGAGVLPDVSGHPDYVARGGVLSDVERFDAGFFGFTPLEAACLSPQNRLLFECVWEAIENAGHDPLAGQGATGLFVGQSQDRYWSDHVEPHAGEMDAELAFFSNPDFLATGIAYKLNLRGPAMTVQSFCSTSLLAVHLARQSLLEGECDMALAGGTSVRVPQHQGYRYVPDGIFSPDGVVRTFDAGANGTLFGNGVGVVALRRLEDALADRDPIIAILRGSAANNDGNAKAGYNAPSVEGQARAVARALADAEVPADSITYVECHGTGTLMGDPIEIAALNRAYRRSTDRSGFCAVGSIKPNVGHLDRASGVCGLIKTVLALYHGEIPGLINFKTPNPRIDFEGSPFYVAREHQSWPAGDGPRRAGVNSLGYGGTNVHVILEEAVCVRPGDAVPTGQVWPHLLVLSARTAKALGSLADALADHIEADPDISLGDVAHTLQVGRHGFNHRLVVLAHDRMEAVDRLRSAQAFGEARIRDPEVVLDLGTISVNDLDLLRERDPALEGVQGTKNDSPDAAMGALLEGWGFRVASSHSAGGERLQVRVVARSGVAQEEGTIGFFDGPVETALPRLVAGLWLAGAEPDWSKLPCAAPARRIALPTARFERARHWFDPGKPETAMLPDDAVARDESPVVLAVPTWRRLSCPSPITPPDCRIVVVDSDGLGDSLADRLERDGETIVRVRHRPDGKVANVADGVYTADLGSEEQIEALLTRLKLWNPGALVSCLPLDLTPAEPAQAPLDARMDAGLAQSLFAPARWLRSISAVWPDRPFRVDFVSRNLFQVTGGDPVHPENAPLAALVRVAGEEYPTLDVHCLEIDYRSEPSRSVAALAADLQVALPRLTARRGHQRWVPDIQAEHFQEPAFEKRLRPGGAYLILGGLGGVGWTIARYLARQAGARLAIVGRSLPAPGDESRAAGRLKALVDLAPEVMTAAVDVTDRQTMASVLAEMRARFGRIDGIIHAVHHAGGVLLDDLTPAAAQPALAGKVAAVPALIELLQDDPPDFLLLCSSMASLEPSRGQIDHAAACAVVDAIAQSRAAGFPVLCVNWCSWRGLGAAHDAWHAVVESQVVDHPILYRREVTSAGEIRYCGRLDGERDWVVAEHLLHGNPGLSGSGAIDLILAACRDRFGRDKGLQAVRLQPLVFLKPLIVVGEQPKEFTIVFHDTEAGVSVRLESYDAEENPVVHARAVVQTLAAPGDDSEPVLLEPSNPIPLPARPNGESLSLGERWNCLTDLALMADGTRACLELARAFRSDLDKVVVHAALLDMATSVAVRAAAGDVDLLPIGCGVFDFHRPPGGRLTAYAGNVVTGEDGSRRVSLRLFDADGNLAIEVKDMTFAEPEAAGKVLKRLADHVVVEPENPFMADSISAEEGIAALRRLPIGDVVQVLVARGLNASVPSGHAVAAPLHAAAREVTDIPAFLARTWQRVLGLEVPDNQAGFFELGGDSLAATRVLSRIRDTLDVKVTLKDFFANPTLAALTRLVETRMASGRTQEEPRNENASNDQAEARPGPLPETGEWETGVL